MVLNATSKMVRTLSARIRCLRLKRPDHFSRRSASSLLVEAITDAIEGIDRVEARVDGSELAPDALDVAVDGAVVDINVVAIGDVEQLVAAFYDSRPLRESFEDHELGHREANDTSVPQHFVACRIHRKPTPLEPRRLGLRGGRARIIPFEVLPSKDRANARDQQPL